MISAATFQLLGGFFACQPLGTPLLKGLAQPLTVYRVLYESMARSRLEAVGSTDWTPLVGREQESGLLLERWAQVKDGFGQQVGEISQLVPVLYGLWRFYVVRQQFQIAHDLGETLLGLTQTADDPAISVSARYALGVYVIVAWRIACGLPAPGGGYPALHARPTPYVPAVHAQAEAAVALSTEQGFPQWVAYGTLLRGWALALQGQREAGVIQAREGLTARRATGVALNIPYFCTVLADICEPLGHPEDGLQALAEAHTLLEQHEARWWETVGPHWSPGPHGGV